jgi:hypothetical protein
MPFEEGAILFLAMMFHLAGNVFTHGGDIGFGDSERPIPGLPRKPGEFPALGFDPFRGSLFDLFHGIADRDGSAKFKENVNVVFDRIDQDWRAVQVLQNSGHVAVQGVAHRVMQNGFTIFSAEDEVKVEPGERLWHGLERPFRALICWAIPAQGVALGWG